MHVQVGRYANTGDALAKIVQTEGVAALFRGIGPSVLAIIPEAAITYGVFSALLQALISIKTSFTTVSSLSLYFVEPGCCMQRAGLLGSSSCYT